MLGGVAKNKRFIGMVRLLLVVCVGGGFLPSVSRAAVDYKVEATDATIIEKGNPGYVGKPISLVSGTESLSRVDLTLGNFPIYIKRRYTSVSGYDSPLGYGWAHNYDKRLYTYADGSVIIRKETGWKRHFMPSGTGFTTPVGETGILTTNPDGTHTYTEKDGSAETYDINGRLTTMTDIKGNSLVLSYEAATKAPLWGLLPWNVLQTDPLVVAYDYRLSTVEEHDTTGTPTGRWVHFSYDAQTGRLTQITDSLSRTITYDHDSIGNLKSVSSPQFNSLYGYTDTNDKHLLTTIDEGEGMYVNSYDSQGKVIKQTHGTGTIDISYIIPRQKTTVTTTIKDGTGTLLNTQNRVVTFDQSGQVAKVTDTFGNETRYTRNSQTWVTREEKWENTGTVASPNLVLKYAADYTYDAVGNLLTRTDAQGTAIEKTTTYTYHPIFGNVLTEKVKSVVNPAQDRVTTNDYDTKGNLLSTTETGLLGDGTPYSYITSYEYDSQSRLKKIDGPRTDVQDVTTFTYDASGNMLTKTEPVVGTTYDNYDGLGNPGTITDSNGNATLYTYDAVGRVLTVKAPGDTAATQIGYTTGSCSSCGGVANRIDHMIFPEGNRLDFLYDTNGKLSKISDGLGNSLNYSYDSEGNKLKEEIKDPTGVLQKTLSYQYDALNRLKQVKNPDATYTEYGYDSLGNVTSSKDPKGSTITSQYDALRRVTATIQPGTITTGFSYNTNNNLATVTDGNNNSTVYKYDDKGRVYQAISPDTGTTTYTYDPAGNLKTKTDAKGITITYTYDAANRLITTTFPTDSANIYNYDTCPNGKGWLCAVTDQSGTTSYEYTKKGQVAKETRTIDSIAYTTQYTYDMNGNTKTITYPSSRVITYNYTNDRVTSVTGTLGGITTTLAGSITYKPFGGLTTLTYGNGLARTIAYDNQYRPASIVTGTVQNLTYGYDANGNITAITNNLDNTKNKTYTYDNLDRLGSGSGPWGTISWLYDGVGNRTSQTDSSGTSSYSYQPGTNKLTSVSGPSPASFSYDANGNTTNENSKTYTYSQNQRLIQATAEQTGSYSYNANGQRAKKVVNGITTYFIFDQQGQLIAESATDGTQADYIYLSNQPLAKIDATGISYIHTDHLGTPTFMTDGTGAKAWEVEARPFGDNATITGLASLNFRFPGQYADGETGNNYNYFRDYNPAIGRYIQKDPIGFAGGINLYAYVDNNPVNWTDPTGEAAVGPLPKPPPTIPTIPPPPRPPIKPPKPPGTGCSAMFRVCTAFCTTRCPGGVVGKGVCLAACTAAWISCVTMGN
ncbi:RHS repeat protein [Geotalea daltonii FRC-32]|uniref:RHS repeat protein n=1 Tax=Geotalea daltonii (strain DSM 22248 / JCM 15807 / FRC-32) TaxID=316067 RepID=B9M6Z5_GEODF|nr:RHS repeat-associated core domain-containing protein [Geotalea daltonii]ACM22016.1 RHS repeat protein [Geotalea daltonii FRC-32]